jgi:hypothetical protein
VVFTAASAATARNARQHVIKTPSTLPLRTAILDQPLLASSQRDEGLKMIRAAGARYVRVNVSWRSIAPLVLPSGFVASNPRSAGYRWAGVDSVVQAADAAGLTPILDIGSTPPWAYSVTPVGEDAGTPNVADLGDFATAIATHFDGSTPGVPAEHVFQVWNEVNNSRDLSPVDAGAYREMVNAVAGAVHKVDPASFVVAGALDPLGHPKSSKQNWYSVAPLTFMRSFLCLSKGAHPHATCHKPAHFDAWSHHPYTYGGPFHHAHLHGDVELGDLPEMRALLRAGARLHNIVSAHRVQFWVTEFGWDSAPPRPTAAPMPLAARWTAESLHQMWLSGVSLATWFLLEDYPSPTPYASGLYFYAPNVANARPKPMLTAFRFPFVAYLGKKKHVSVWGRDATSKKVLVTVQLRHGKSGKWRTIALVKSNGFGIFEANLKRKASKKDWLRAVAPGSGNSLAFSLKKPKNLHYGPWGN